MKTPIAAAFAAVLLLVPVLAARAAESDAPNGARAQQPALAASDRRFAIKAAAAGVDEVEEAKLADKKSQAADVRQFASRMQRDHTAADERLRALASGKALDLPGKLDKSSEQALDRLGKLSGAKFDAAYAKHNLSAHQKAVKDFGKEAKSGKDADLRQFASETLPTLEEHLRLAEALAKAHPAAKPGGKQG